MCTKKPIKEHAHANCYVRLYDDGNVVLMSYTTPVIFYDAGLHTLSCSGLYSATTRKHIGWFLKEYFPTVTYQDIKRIAGTRQVVKGVRL